MCKANICITGENCCGKSFSYSLIMAILVGLICLIIMENHVDARRIEELVEKTHVEHYKNTSLLKLTIPRTSEYLEYNIVDNDNDTVLQDKADQSSHHNNVPSPEINLDSEPRNYCALDERDFIESELERAKEHLNKYNYLISLEVYNNLALKYPDSPAALYGQISVFNLILTLTISTDISQSLKEVCFKYLELDDLISDEEFKWVSYLCIKQMKLINEVDATIDIYLQLLKRFDDDWSIRNELADEYIGLQRLSDAKYILQENLKRWPSNGTSLAYYGYVHYYENNFEHAVHYLLLGLATDEYITQNKDYYSILGTTLLLLNRTEEGRKVFRRAVTMKLFPSEYQRSESYIRELKAQPIWTKEETPYIDMYDLLESNWQRIRDEGLSILSKRGYFRNQVDGLTNVGIWQVFHLVSLGKKILKNCEIAQFTYGLFQSYIRHICYSCDIFFSVVYPDTHIIPHCGTHNARLTVHLGLKVPNDTRIRIGEDERSWEEGKLLIFDDSFEHEIWHKGNDIRLLLIVDFWHPQVTDDHKAFIKQLG